MLGCLLSQQHGSELFHVWSWCALHRVQTSADPYAQVNTYYRKKEKAIAHSLATLCLVAFRASIQEWNDKSDNLTMLRLLVLTDFFLYRWKAFEAGALLLVDSSLQSVEVMRNVFYQPQKQIMIWRRDAGTRKKYSLVAECGRPPLLTFHSSCRHMIAPSAKSMSCFFLLFTQSHWTFLEATNPGRKKWQ